MILPVFNLRPGSKTFIDRMSLFRKKPDPSYDVGIKPRGFRRKHGRVALRGGSALCVLGCFIIDSNVAKRLIP